VVDKAALSTDALVLIWNNSRRHVPENRNFPAYDYNQLARGRFRRLFGVTDVSL
jgi:hypothetical protein